jgi:hypothetical protein
LELRADRERLAEMERLLSESLACDCTDLLSCVRGTEAARRVGVPRKRHRRVALGQG